MVDLNGYLGKNLRITFADGTIIEAIGEEYMYGDDSDEEFNSLALRVTKVIKDREKFPFRVFVGDSNLTGIYENEDVTIEVL